MVNRSARLTMSTSILEAVPGKLDIKRHSPTILYLFSNILGRYRSELGCQLGQAIPEKP